MNRSELKILIKEILNEWRGMTSGEWVEPNGTPHDLGHTQDMSDHHYDWAEKYLKTHGPHRFKDDPREELVARGWARVVYSPTDYVIMVMTGHRNYSYLTKAQRDYLEDQSEELQWNVVDDELNTIYEPMDTKTPKSDVWPGKMSEDHGLGYSHNVSFDMTPKERDPLNDPRLTGKMHEGYRFKDHDWLANREGFHKPTDVYSDLIHLGVIISEPEGYVIATISGPNGQINIKKTPNNKFKTKMRAAEILHKAWKRERINT